VLRKVSWVLLKFEFPVAPERAKDAPNYWLAAPRFPLEPKRRRTASEAILELSVIAGVWKAMKRYYFDLIGEVPARDFLGHECSSRNEARKHASFIAHRIGNEHPHFVKPENRIAVREEGGAAFYQAPIALTSRAGLH
jgi:hypothetical protein